MGTQEKLRLNLTSLAISYLHVLYLTRDGLQATMECFPREQELIKRSYRSLVLMRGIVWKARQLSREYARKENAQNSPTLRQSTTFLDRLSTFEDSDDPTRV